MKLALVRSALCSAPKCRCRPPNLTVRVSILPPAIKLTGLGFTLISGWLDYIDARPVGAIIYRRLHVINLFVAQTASTESRAARTETFQGFNVRSWSEGGLNYWRSPTSPPTNSPNSARSFSAR